MQDTQTKVPELRKARIKVNDPYEVHHWAKVFGVTDFDVAIAVRAAGPKPQDVALALGKPWH
jgi:hypothetical protein